MDAVTKGKIADFSLPHISLADDLPVWTTFEIKKMALPAENRECFIMGDHLVVVYLQSHQNLNSKDSNCRIHILAFNLLDHSIQEAEIGSVKCEEYGFAKYNGNRMLCYGFPSWNLANLTLESFTPLKVKFEEVEHQDHSVAFKQRPVGQVFQENLYVFGSIPLGGYELLSFSLGNREWKSWGNPFSLFSRDPLNSFIYQDRLFIYESRNFTGTLEHYSLDLKQMSEKRCDTPEKYQSTKAWAHGCAVYEGNLVFLKDEEVPSAWASFNTKGDIGKSLPGYSNLMIYKNLVLTLAYKEETLVVSAMSLDSFGLLGPESPEEISLSQLYLSQSGSDITFKVGRYHYSAHKQVLEKNSRYFADILNTEFITDELKQNFIEIRDCESQIFGEYLRFIYQKIVIIEDTNQVIKLYSLARKYLQEDLCERCVWILLHNINKQNVYKILKFARQEKILKLTRWCLIFFENYSIISDVFELIEYLDGQEDSEFKEELGKIALNAVLDLFVEIYKHGDVGYRFCTNFLLRNIEMSTLPAFAKAIKKYVHFQRKHQTEEEEYNGIFINPAFNSESFLKNIKQVREATLSLIHENVKTLLTNEGISKDSMDLIFAFLFMSQAGSDITLKVQGNLIPAHKQILVKKSRYFERVFNSGMAESKQDVIEIQEDYEIFKEYLRYVYQGEVHLDDDSQILKLYFLADKYLEEDLCEACVGILSKNIKENNFSQLLEFAHERDLSGLKSCCVAFFRKQINAKNVAQVIEFLDRQDVLTESKENNEELKNIALNFIVHSFFDEKGDVEVYKSFLLKNIRIDTISLLVYFLSHSYWFSKINRPQDSESVSFLGGEMTFGTARELFKERTTQLKEAVFSFIHENAKTIMTGPISEGFSIDFFRDFTLYCTEMNHENNNNEKKRMEPVQDGSNEENSALEKTKN